MLGSVITGILATRNSKPEYVSTVLYPLLTTETLSISNLGLARGVLWENPNDDTKIGTLGIISGTLTETIVFKSYNEIAALEPISIGVLGIPSGTLTETIVYRNYNNGDIEPLGIGVLGIPSGTLTETIVYQNYNNGAIESMNIGGLSIQSGTLA